MVAEVYFFYAGAKLHSIRIIVLIDDICSSFGDYHRVSLPVQASKLILLHTFWKVMLIFAFSKSLLGWAAFAGFLVLLVGWPLNSYITKRSIRIQKGVATARDKRMGILNELISAVRIIIFFLSIDLSMCVETGAGDIGKIHQIFRLGGAMDSANAWFQANWAKVDDERCIFWSISWCSSFLSKSVTDTRCLN